MDNKNLAREGKEEKSFAGAINKIKLLKGIRPQENWVIFCRENLTMRIKMERKKELLNKDFFALQGLFAFLRGVKQPKYYLRTLYALSLVVVLVLTGGTLTAWAAMKSLPGSALYPIKIALEKAHLLIVSDEGKNKLQGQMTNRRLQELKAVVEGQGSPEDKNKQVGEVVEHIQQQLITEKGQLPQITKKDGPDKAIITVKEMAERAEQVKKALVQAKESLPGEINQNLSEKLTEAVAAADQTSIQALEAMINKQKKTEAEIKEILVKFESIIKEKETAIENLKVIKQQIVLATSTADRLPINAVLINQADEAEDFLDKVKASLEQGDLAIALETLKILNEIVKGTERMVESSVFQESLKTELPTGVQSATSSLPSEPIK